jgi:hypothetical protein
VALAAIILGTALALLLPADREAADVVTGEAHLPDPATSLGQAEKATPYAIKLPADLPAGTRTLLVDWVIAGASKTGRVVNVDAWYETPEHHRIHVWQTNSQMIRTSGQDPSAPTAGSPVSLPAGLWQENHFDWGRQPWIELGRRFPNGVTVSVSGPAALGASSLRSIAASIE